MKEHSRFVIGAVSAILAACCLVGAVLTAWLRGAAGAVARAAAWTVMQPAAAEAEQEEPVPALAEVSGTAEEMPPAAAGTAHGAAGGTGRFKPGAPPGKAAADTVRNRSGP